MGEGGVRWILGGVGDRTTRECGVEFALLREKEEEEDGMVIIQRQQREKREEGDEDDGRGEYERKM